MQKTTATKQLRRSNRLNDKSNNSNKSRSLISITRDEDKDYFEEILNESQFNSNEEDYQQQSEHRNYRDYLESNEHIYDTINNGCFGLCPIHCKSSAKSIDKNNNHSSVRINSEINSKINKKCNSILKNKIEDKQTSIKRSVRFEDDNSINEYSDCDNSDCDNQIDKSKCSKYDNKINESSNSNYDRINKSNYSNHTKINGSKYSNYANRINESRYLDYDNKINESRYLDYDNKIDESRCSNYNNFYQYYFDTISVKWYDLMIYLKNDLFNHQNRIFFFAYLFIIFIIFILHFLIQNYLLTDQQKSDFKLSVLNFIDLVQQFFLSFLYQIWYMIKDVLPKKDYVNYFDSLLIDLKKLLIIK